MQKLLGDDTQVQPLACPYQPCPYQPWRLVQNPGPLAGQVQTGVQVVPCIGAGCSAYYPSEVAGPSCRAYAAGFALPLTKGVAE